LHFGGRAGAPVARIFQGFTPALNTADLDIRIAELGTQNEKMKRAWNAGLRRARRVTAAASCKSPVDSLYYQAGRLFSAAERLFFCRSFA
jgi:hypothetical protein